MQPVFRESTQSFTPRDGRLLIGGADWCDCRLEQLQPVAALVANYGHRWVLHNLHASTVKCDSVDVPTRCDLEREQTWTVGPYQLDSVWDDAGEPGPASGGLGRPSAFSVAADGGFLQRHETDADFLIGTAHVCDVAAPVESGLEPRHALLACVDGRWSLHDLTGQGGIRDGNAWTGSIELEPGNIVAVGPLTIGVELSAATPFPPVGTPRPQSVAASGPAPIAAPRQTLPPVAIRDAAPIDDDVTREQVDEDALKIAQRIYNQLKSVHALRAGEKQNWTLRFRGVLSQVQAEKDFTAGYRVKAFTQMERLLTRDPWNRRLLMSICRMCDVARLDQLCFNFLNLMLKQDSRDVTVHRGLARLCRHLGRNDPRFLERAAQHWDAVRTLSPSAEEEADAAIREIESQHQAFGG